MSEPDDDNESCWNNLENHRVKLISVVDPSRITPYLRQCKVINHDDEEQILNDPSLVIRKRKAGVLLDILQRTGQKGFVAFLESLELYYPHLYKKITGNEPTRVFSMIIDTAGESSLTELLMSEISKLQNAVREERRKLQETGVLLRAKEDVIREMRVRDSVLRKHQERAHKMKEERDSLSRELKCCKDENYELAMRYARQSEEKNVALMKNRDLQLEIDCLRHSLMKAEDDCRLERKHTLKLKHAIEQRPSHEVVWEIQREKELLLAKNKELESTLQVTKTGSFEEEDISIQALQAERTQMLGEHQKLVNTIYDLRQMLRRTEDKRDKLVEEKEMLELKCASLQNDAQIYQDRIEVILKQMEEVASERDQTSDFEESSRSSQELPPLGNPDEDMKGANKESSNQQFSKIQLLPSPGESSPLDGEVAEKGRRRMKDSFEHYRRKRALRRAQKGKYYTVDWENTSGSDNTDTEGS
ncbi:caspase recruitment domain-containing protein 9 isoform X1 [Zootoca vivipara]|uniref:caspase recruitment domain-containing protein 9 isoform X1 n=1 Tax=Zootoca vivipara TaxID=8524 RepID=UPI0015901BAC|nr:caspase recruitment domain-containing protein 9 isoform X2 [Zootoca vivipara]XP_060126281.1 caspase recruitment domain-containing protein 9 isoform X1 [Zootoca vivipara]